MERNDVGNGGTPGGQPDANEFSGSATAPERTDAGNAGVAAAGFDFEATPSTSEPAQSVRERAKNAIGTAGAKLADVGTTVRERAGTAKDKVADALESGAEKLRQRTHSGGETAGTLAGATAAGSMPLEGDGRVAQVTDRLAGGMDATAEWIREADLDSLKAGLERQVKEHPGRTLLIAAGLGYLIGRAFRGNH